MKAMPRRKASAVARVYDATRVAIHSLRRLSFAEDLKESPLAILNIVLLDRFCWASKEERSFQVVGCWHERSELKVWWKDSTAFVVLVEPLVERSRTFHMW